MTTTEKKCEGNCPNTCKAHMGVYTYCTNAGCVCHSWRMTAPFSENTEPSSPPPQTGDWEPSEAQKRYWASMRGKRGADTPRWKGMAANKISKHQWLYANHGQPQVCENPDCKGKSKWFDWCLKTGREYSHNREDYLRMCRSCHRAYDLTPELREKAIINLKKHNPYYGTERNVV